jgi:hypothetical protein
MGAPDSVLSILLQSASLLLPSFLVMVADNLETQPPMAPVAPISVTSHTDNLDNVHEITMTIPQSHDTSLLTHCLPILAHSLLIFTFVLTTHPCSHSPHACWSLCTFLHCISPLHITLHSCAPHHIMHLHIMACQKNWLASAEYVT